MADTVTEFDFFDSILTTNTLHLPDGELRYTDVGMFQNQKLDLRITVTSGDYTDIAQVWSDRGKDPEKKNGKGGDGSFGNINLQTVKGEPKSGEGNFRFCVVNEGTNDPITLEQFSWTIFDLDERGKDKGNNGVGLKEKFIMDVSQAEVYQLIEDTEVVVSCEDGTDSPCAPGVRTVFHSSTNGKGEDNPEDPNDLTHVQMARSVSFTFKDTSCWDITYDHYCPVDQPGYTATDDTECRKYNGGNFLFSGSAEQIIEEGECLTMSPTLSPSDSPTATPTTSSTTSEPTSITTESPTSVPTFLNSEIPPVPYGIYTSSPSSSPTTGPDFSPPLPYCAEDLKLLQTNGITEIELDSAIQIVKQDTNSVTVRLQQSWTSSAEDKLDHIFYQYEEGLFKSDCKEETDVPGGEVYSPEDITIQCMHDKPITKMTICVADSDGGFLDPVHDTATVPKCCHPEFDSDVVPTVCYKVLIECSSQCVDAVERRSLRGGAQALL